MTSLSATIVQGPASGVGVAVEVGLGEGVAVGLGDGVGEGDAVAVAVGTGAVDVARNPGRKPHPATKAASTTATSPQGARISFITFYNNGKALRDKE